MTVVDAVLVVILNWNRMDETVACLSGALRLTHRTLGIVVVDNGSSESIIDGVEHTCHAFGWSINSSAGSAPVLPVPGMRQVSVVETGRNLGFAGGNNVALRGAATSGYKWVLVVNNDCEIPTDLLERMLESAYARRRIGVVGCRIVSRHGHQVEYEGGTRRWWLGVHVLRRWHGRRGTLAVNFVPGTTMLINTALVGELEGFDERYFMYVEDADFSYRAAALGWGLCVNLETEVRHGWSISLGGRRSPAYYYYVTRNTLFMISWRFVGLMRITAMLAFACQTAARCALFAARWRRPHVLAVLIGVGHFLGSRHGQAPGFIHGAGSLSPPQGG